MKTKNYRSLLPLIGLALLVGAGAPKAATIGINVPGSQATVYYTGNLGDVVGYLEDKTTSDNMAFVFNINSLTGSNGFDAPNEVAAMNLVAGTNFSSSEVLKNDQPNPNSVTINTEYFSMKPGGGQTIAFFRNTTGGSITLTWTAGQAGGLSHYSQYGNPVPLPAAAYLFGSALLGMAGIGYRRNKKQA